MNIADINTLTRFLTGTDTNSYTAPNLLIAINASYERVTGKILAETAGSKWQYGDSNYTAFPTYDMDLISGRDSYSLRKGTLAYDGEDAPFTAGLVLTGTTSGATAMIEAAQDDGATGTLTLSDIDGTFQDNEDITDSGSGDASVNGLLVDLSPLKIMGVEVLDQDGNYQVVWPLGFSSLRRTGVAQSEYAKTDGRPFEYELRENRIVLYPAADNGVTVTLLDGLRLFFLQTADKFTSTEVTTAAKTPGFPVPWHDILSYEAGYMFAVAKGLENSQQLFFEFNRKEKEMLQFISRRNQDNKPVMKMRGSRRGRGHLTADGGHHHGHHFI